MHASQEAEASSNASLVFLALELSDRLLGVWLDQRGPVLLDPVNILRPEPNRDVKIGRLQSELGAESVGLGPLHHAKVGLVAVLRRAAQPDLHWPWRGAEARSEVAQQGLLGHAARHHEARSGGEGRGGGGRGCGRGGTIAVSVR